MNIKRIRGEKGASLVEFAIIAPLLILLLFGIIEFGWGLSQNLDMRHKARESLRLAIVDATPAEVTDRVCANDLVRASAITQLERFGGTDPGDDVTVTITANLQEITGLFGWFWGANPILSSTVSGRVEQPATNWLPNQGDDSDLAPCP